MTGTGITVDGWWITVCGGRDVAGAAYLAIRTGVRR